MILYIVSRENFGFRQYENIISKIYYTALVLYGLVGLIKQEKVDELVERILSKVNKICMIVADIGLILLIILVAASDFKRIYITRDMIGLLMLLLLFTIASLKPVLFYYFDKKGL
ncbi:hypothetical protein KQI42_01735 [Tissierella sp. MSJ-40]|uniref:Uncharacterized protein n=1 Tax=Tissierella simiarum TaxID=2841534 RepID=A0ABS6E1N8_9FIRM|nr:hypothetical protein [Tissierella simiarum]MBU5436707.1 hypothetical protein [Tissierella simiarum]